MQSVPSIDANLTAKSKSDNPAFSELYSSIHDELYRYCLYFLCNREDALDAVQETAIAAYKGFDALHNTDSFKAWIFKIAYRICKQHIGYISFRRNMLNMDELDICCDKHNIDDIDNALTITNALQSLSLHDRNLILLSLVCGYKSSEIAQMLGKSDQAVRTALSRAVKKLRNQLEKECV